VKARVLAVLLFVVVFAVPSLVNAHCDNVRGPLVADAKKALASGDVTIVLKWVRPSDEAEVRSAFEKTMAVRGASDLARDVADDWFFQTVVRVHRASEGEGFTGLKTAPMPEALVMADASIARGDIDHLVAHLNGATESLIRTRFRDLQAARARSGESVEAGRRYIAAYASFMRVIEQLSGGDHDGAAH
jgi:hypothetical protein